MEGCETLRLTNELGVAAQESWKTRIERSVKGKKRKNILNKW